MDQEVIGLEYRQKMLIFKNDMGNFERLRRYFWHLNNELLKTIVKGKTTIILAEST